MHGTRSEKLYERKHEVEVSLHRGYAELRVRRSVENQGARHDQAMFWLTLPDGAAATGLKTLGSVAGRPVWFAGELMEAEAAAAKYKELTGIGGYYPKDPALLSWRQQGQLLLQVFPVAPGTSKSVEYTLLVPTHYERGAHRYVLPGLGTTELAAQVSLGAAARGDKLLMDDRPAAKGASVRAALGATAELGLVPKTTEPVGGELAVSAAGSRFVTHFSIEAAPRVAKVPRAAQIVVLLDASRSLSSDLLAAEQAALSAYLSHFPDASVEVISFDRKLHRRYGAFVPVARARSDLTTQKIEQKNGSAIDAALAEAETILAAAPAGRARRLVLVSDAIVRSKLKPERIRAALGASGAVAHIGVLRSRGVSLSRDDTHAWADAVARTGGLVWQASASDARGDSKRMASVYEEWARPLRVDHLKLYSPDLEMGAITQPPQSLDEGQGYEQLLMSQRDVAWVRVEGQLWSKSVQHVVHADAAAGKRWAALVFGSPLLGELTEPEMMQLALAGGAVSPVTSYLAIEPGVRPSTEGLERSESGMGSGFGRAPQLRMGATSASGRAPPLDREQWLRDTLEPTFIACGGTADSASVSLETTFAEVVDVTRVELSTSADPLLQRCLSEAVWDLVLPPQFDEEWTTWMVQL